MNRGYLRRGPGARKRRGERTRVNEEPRGTLDFEKPSDEVSHEQPPHDPGYHNGTAHPTRRAASLGFAGETTGRRDAGDDLEPADTLIDRDGSGARGDPMGHIPQDARLEVQNVPAGVTGEVQDSNDEPVGRQEAQRIKRRIRQHARNPNSFEPHEQAELAARRAAAKPRPHP